jgi:GTPase SAR1 family protein
MGRDSMSPAALAERLCRTQRIGIFGHRGVGKTTLLTMFYREAVGGRMPGLRLAAADAATANYLSDKIHQLEDGDVLPATLAETELRFQLYHQGARLELIFKDYQGEHVAIGRHEPIRDFLRDCDAVWLCFDPVLLSSKHGNMTGQQEAEQLIEDYLAVEPRKALHRPMALVLTKADLLQGEDTADHSASLAALVERHFGMTLHALRQHCPSNAVFAVSSLGPRTPGAPLLPLYLDRPLRWLAGALQAQDESRLDFLFAEAPGRIGMLGQCVDAFARRYPEAKRLPEYRQRLQALTTRRRKRRAILAAVVAVLLLGGLWGYDTYAYQQAKSFEANVDDPSAALERWQSYVNSPISLRPSARQRVRELEEEVTLRDLRQRASDPTADAVALWKDFQAASARFPDNPELLTLHSRLEERRNKHGLAAAQAALDELERAEQQVPRGAAARPRLEELLAMAAKALTEHADTPLESKLRQRRDTYLFRIDEHDFEEAREYSSREPLSFRTRMDRYQAYLDRHPSGAFEKQARAALAEVESAWDKHDFRLVRDLFVDRPDRLKELTARCERYLQVHPRGRFVASARELMRFAEQVKTEREYKVTAVRGEFSSNLGRWYTRGPDLSIEIEVAGAKYGPSGILKNSYNPGWDYEFPRPIRWKLGDTVKIKVHDNDFWGRTIIDFTSEDKETLALRLLSGKLEIGEHTLYFASDFRMPQLPRID